MTALPVFLSAYDPAELPGGSVDPLGFTGGYLALADEMFPGMTAAAGQGTYLAVLCAALQVAEDHGKLGGLSTAAARAGRIDIALRLERLWALACALHAADAGDAPDQTPHRADGDNPVEVGDSRIPGLRGITYVEKERRRLDSQARARAKFPLLAQQYRYGMFGIYGGVAEELRLIDKSTLLATRGFGASLGQDFFEQTTAHLNRKELLSAVVKDDATIAVDTLRAWGRRAFVDLQLIGVAKDRLRDALVTNTNRRVMLEALQTVAPPPGAAWTDMGLLSAASQHLQQQGHARLPAAIEAACAYDALLRSFSLIFERVMWRCRAVGDREALSVLGSDPVVTEASAHLPQLADALVQRHEVLLSQSVLALTRRGRGIVEVACRAAELRRADDTLRLVLTRHAEIQRAKIDRGRPKQPWVQIEGANAVLTSTGFGGRSAELRTPQQVRAPNWRVGAALSFLNIAGGLPQKGAT